MASRVTPASVRPRPSRTLLISLASAVIVILATLGIWLGCHGGVVGFDVWAGVLRRHARLCTAESDGALFYAAGGYHHHVATNTWGSAGATDRPESLGLGSLTVHVGDEDALGAVVDRLTDAGATFTQEASVITVDDPWGNTVRLLA